jgi:phosphoglycerol transferase MdoB-like AlkP superfamily enzyme
MYLRVFTQALAFDMLFIVDHILDVKSSAISLLGKRDLFLLILVMGTIFPFLIKRKLGGMNLSRKINRKKISCELGTCVFLFLIWWGTLFGTNTSIHQVLNASGMEGIRYLNVVGYYSVEFFSGVKRTIFPRKVPISEIKELKDYLIAQKKEKDFLEENFNSDIKTPNFIVIQVESLMSWILGLNVDGRPVTPFLNSLMTDAIYCENFYSICHATCDSDFSTLTSLIPHSRTRAHIDYYLNNFQSLPKVFGQNGYSTFYANPCRQHFWNVKGMNRSLGFQHSVFQDNLEKTEILGFGISDKEFFRQVRHLLKNLKKPYFSMLLSASSHHPFLFSNTPMTFPLDKMPWKDKFTQAYVQMINYTDSALKQFIESLSNEGILNDTIVVIYGDHPIRLTPIWVPIEEKFEKFPNFQEIVRVETAKIPLFIIHPRLGAKKISKLCSQIDIGPTLLNLGNIDIPAEFLGAPINKKGSGIFLHKHHCGKSEETIFYEPNFQDGSYRYAIDLKKQKMVSSKQFDALFFKSKISDLMISNNLGHLDEINKLLNKTSH